MRNVISLNENWTLTFPKGERPAMLNLPKSLKSLKKHLLKLLNIMTTYRQLLRGMSWK